MFFFFKSCDAYNSMFNYINKIFFKNYNSKNTSSIEETPHCRTPSLQFLSLHNLITKPITAPNPWSFISKLHTKRN